MTRPFRIDFHEKNNRNPVSEFAPLLGNGGIYVLLKMQIIDSLNTDRLHLRVPQLRDAQSIFDSYAQDAEVCRYMTWSPYTEQETYEAWLSEKINSIGKTAVTFVICDIKHPSKVVGMVDARVESFKAEIGYALSKDEWGKGLMTEAVSAFVKLLLSIDGIYRVSAVCDLENSASAKVMKKSGMSYEGILRRYIIHPNISEEPRDVKSYSLTK
ncbi:MAG: GNAT family N-acetyltransferase [Akkermansiaceae bacterium]